MLTVHYGRYGRSVQACHRDKLKDGQDSLVVSWPRPLHRNDVGKVLLYFPFPSDNRAGRSEDLALQGLQGAFLVVIDEVDSVPFVAFRGPGQFQRVAGGVVAREGEAGGGHGVGVHRPEGILKTSFVKHCGAVPGDDRTIVVPEGGSPLRPVQMRGFVEIPGQNHVGALVDVGPAEPDEIPDGIVPSGIPVHLQDGLCRGHGSGNLLPGVPVVTSRIVAGVVPVVQMGGVKCDRMASDIDLDPLDGAAALPFPAVGHKREPADDPAVAGGVLPVECLSPQGEGPDQARDESHVSLVSDFLHKDHVRPTFDDVVHKDVESSRDVRAFLPDVDLKHPDSFPSFGEEGEQNHQYDGYQSYVFHNMNYNIYPMTYTDKNTQIYRVSPAFAEQ